MARVSSQADTDHFDDVEAMTFEQALTALEEIVRNLEEGEIDLDGAIEAYARGAALKGIARENCGRRSSVSAELLWGQTAL